MMSGATRNLLSTQTIQHETKQLEPVEESAPVEAGEAAAPAVRQRKSFMDKIEAFLSRLSVRNHFWHRLSSMIWLPYAFRSGIKIKRLDEQTFTAILPFRRFNRNWYNAMAGAALLGNSEIAGGAYVFGICGGDYTVVCKNLEYRFLRPCFGPALYKIRAHDDVEALVAAGGEFNVTLTLDVVQDIRKPLDRHKRVGRCTATFHATPKSDSKRKRSSKSEP
jgi:hypothetical protein